MGGLEEEVGVLDRISNPKEAVVGAKNSFAVGAHIAEPKAWSRGQPPKLCAGLARGNLGMAPHFGE